MLKHLGEWLDSWNGFAERHYVFSSVTYGVLAFLAVVLFLFGAIAFAIENSPEPSDILWEGDVQTEDTRIVHCIATTDGMSCDWTHASGADNL